MLASYGDYIIKGLKGELYPCKADIFEMSYNPVGDYRQRLVLEKEELDIKMLALSKFFDTKFFLDLPDVEQNLLRKQYGYMQRYSSVLSERISNFIN
jgi:hypothetical protein